MAEHQVDKQLEARLFQLLEEQGRVRLGQLVLLRRRARSTGTTLLHAALNAQLVEPDQAAEIAEAVGLPDPMAPPDSVGTSVLDSADLEPVTAEKISPGRIGAGLPVLRPPPLPPRGRDAGPRPLDLPRAPAPVARLPGDRRTLELLPPQPQSELHFSHPAISPEDETGPFDLIDDGFEEVGEPISIHDRRTLRQAQEANWRDTEPPSLSGAPDESLRALDDALADLPGGEQRYALGDELGRGGMGQVLEAEDRALERPVALKLMIDQDDPALGLRFIDEARVTGQLQHPSVPPVYELGRLPDGRLFFAMKRIEGRTLRDVIEDLRDADPARAMGRVRLLTVFARICGAIAYAHSRGIMHRDLKPENIMLGEFGEVTVMDWGLAKHFDAPERPAPRRITQGRFTTQAGDVTGTPHYMPPEQARGDLEALGPQTDIYALGAILYELLTLEPPFDGPTARAIRERVLNEELVPPSRRAPERGIPHEIEQLCLHCLRKAPEERPRSASWIADRVTEFLEGEADRARKSAERARLLEMGQAAAERYYAAAEEHQRLQSAAVVSRARIAPWAPADERRALWEQEDAAQTAQVDAARALSTALAAYHGALGVDGEHLGTREALAALYYSAFEAAERVDDRVRMAHYETLVEAFDDGDAYTDRLKGDGQLEIGRLPRGLEATLYTVHEADRVRRPVRPQQLAHTPVRLDPIPMGSYLLQLEGPGLSPTAVPIFISRRERLRLRLRLFPDTVVGEGFVHVAGGPARLGGDAHAQLGRPAAVVEVDDFFLARAAVSCAEYLAFLDVITAAAGLDAALARAPRAGPMGPPLWPVGPEGRLVVPATDVLGHRWHPDWPVTGVSAYDAEAFCAFLSERSGDRYRLPTELEWEKAARGADGRIFPWGDHWDPTFCHMGISRDGPPDPDPLGGAPTDRSPYGVHDMAGGVSEWTASALDEGGERRVVKGGHWAASPVECRAASRSCHAPLQVLPTVGFRVARDAPG